LDGKNPERLKLFTPGPVNPPSYVLNGLCEPLVHHRSPGFSAVFDRITGKIGALLETGAPVLVLASSATGAMDAVVASLFAEGDEVLVPVMGKFSRRWVEICEVYGVRARVMEVEPGRSPSPEAVREELVRHQDVCGLLLTHCETSTGSLSDLEGVSRAVAGLEKDGRVVLECADCVSSFCVDRLRMDAWGLDCVITASQKGLLSPAGLSFVALGERACGALERVPARNYYLDLRRYFAGGIRSLTPFTPALSLLYAVEAAVERILEVGLEDVLDWERRAARAVTLVVESAGFETLAESQSSAVVAFRVGDLDAETICGTMEDEHGIYLARGQGDLRGKILRISPIGKTRRELVDFSAAFLAAVAGMRDEGETAELRSNEVCDNVGDLMKGRDIWA
jgi:aspartate aminotransferase-like enzyme